MKKTTCLIVLIFWCLSNLYAQQPDAKTMANLADALKNAQQTFPDTTKKKQAYDKIVTDKAIIKKGLMNLIQVDKSYYLEIPPAALGRTVLIVNRIAKGAADMKQVYAGDQINEMLIKFELSKDRQSINVSKQTYNIGALKPGDEMYENVKRSNAEPITAIWPVKATAPDSSKLVDITPLLNSDDAMLGFDPKIKSQAKIGMMVFGGANAVESFAAYPANLNFKLLRTYNAGSGGGVSGAMAKSGLETAADDKYTIVLNSSWVLLPEQPMRMREYDPRVGYFYNPFYDFKANPQGVKMRAMATRWRLEPKPEDVQRYLAGELVEPAKPIIFYIDPTTPEKWIPFLIQGVNDWQKAFEKAGFKNAVMAKRAPTPAEDPNWSLDDARHSAIVYKPSEIPNASGPHVGDPRSGEILESHINWYHNVMLILDSWYVAQAAAVDPRARKPVLDDELMGELIRFVSSHEVGHTLGLRHNFIASNATPVELLRNKAWVEKHGHTASIMDYARFNYVAQPEDQIGPAGLYPRVGDYDEWAIEWGYRWMGNLDEAQEAQKAKDMATAAIKNPRLRWAATLELPGIPDPRATTEDLGDDQMKANTYGMKNLQYVAKNLTAWSTAKGQDYEKLMQRYQYGLLSQYQTYLRHALGYIGGVYSDDLGVADGAPNLYQPAPLAKQQEALAFIDRWGLQPQPWLLNNENILGKFYNPIYQIDKDPQVKIMESMVNSLLAADKLVVIERLNQRFAGQGYQLPAYLKEVQNRIWAELKAERINPLRQQLQNFYLAQMAQLLETPKANPLAKMAEQLGPTGKMIKDQLGGASLPEGSNIRALALANLEQLKGSITTALKNGRFKDELNKAHLKAALGNINKILSAK